LEAGRKKAKGASPRKRWLDVVEKDLEDLGAQNWREIVQDRDKRSDLVMAAKTLGELYESRKKKRKIYSMGHLAARPPWFFHGIPVTHSGFIFGPWLTRFLNLFF